MNDKKSEKLAEPKSLEECVKDMQELLYNFTVLYDRWLDCWTQKESGLELLIDEAGELRNRFIDKADELEKLSETIKKDTNHTLHELGEQINRQAILTVARELGHETSRTVDEIKTAAIKTQNALEKWESNSKHGLIWGMVVALITSFLVSLATVKLLLPEPKLPLNEDTASFLTGGQIIARIYPKLTPKEQEHIHDLINEYAADLLQAKEAKL